MEGYSRGIIGKSTGIIMTLSIQNNSEMERNCIVMEGESRCIRCLMLYYNTLIFNQIDPWIS